MLCGKPAMAHKIRLQPLDSAAKKAGRHPYRPNLYSGLSPCHVESDFAYNCRVKLMLLLLLAASNWTAADYGDGGKIRFQDGTVYLDKCEGITGANFAGAFPRIDYEITLEAMRVEGEDFFCGLTFPYKDDCCTLVVGGWGGRVVGLSCLDGMDACHNEARTYRDFLNGQWYKIRLRVVDGRIQTWIDDKKLIDVGTKGRRVSIRPDSIPSKPLGIASYFTGAAFRNFAIKKLG